MTTVDTEPIRLLCSTSVRMTGRWTFPVYFCLGSDGLRCGGEAKTNRLAVLSEAIDSTQVGRPLVRCSTFASCTCTQVRKTDVINATSATCHWCLRKLRLRFKENMYGFATLSYITEEGRKKREEKRERERNLLLLFGNCNYLSIK